MRESFEGVIEISQRLALRSIKKHAKGNPIVALIELIINSNDSYNCIGVDHPGKIEIEYEKDAFNVNFTVRDKAEGMPISLIKQAFTKFGSLTSGIKDGKKVGGYFGTGAKAALAVMENGKIYSFHNGEFVEYYIWIDEKANKIKWRYHAPIKATEKLRKEHKIGENGTVAYFTSTPPGNPRFNRVYESLANHYRLRKIIMNHRRKIELRDINNPKKKLPLAYKNPEGDEIRRDSFIIEYTGYEDFNVDVVINRANRPISQAGEDRQGGLLIIDEYDNPLDISLFKYDNEPLAAHFFGEAKIDNFVKLLRKEEAVLDQERKGLIRDNPFCACLISELENRLEKEIEKERKRKDEESAEQEDKEETERYKKAFSLFNEIAEKEILEVKRLEEELDDNAKPPENGLLISPSKADITTGKSYSFRLQINPQKINNYELINIEISNPNITLNTKPYKYKKSGKIVDVKWITITPKIADIKATLKVFALDFSTSADIFVVPERDLLLGEGMVFVPESITLRPNKFRKCKLLVYVKIIPHESKINITSDNPDIKIEPLTLIVNEYQADKHIQTFEIEVWGSKDGEDAIITAEYSGLVAFLEAKVRSIEPKEEKGTKGKFFTDKYFDPSDPLQRSSYSDKTGKVHIYYRFPSLKHYLGQNLEHKKSLPAQVLIADLVAEQCFLSIANKVVEHRSVLLDPSQKYIKVQQKTFELSKKYGEQIHKFLVDQELLKEAKTENEKNLQKKLVANSDLIN